MKFDELCNKIMVENTDSFDFTKEDDDKLGELRYNDPQKYEEVAKKLFKKYFSWFDSNSDWKKFKKIMRNSDLFNLYDISQLKNITYKSEYKAKIEDIINKIQKGIEDRTIDNSLGENLKAGLYYFENMNELDEDHPDNYRSILDNMFESGMILYDDSVRDWYKANGYL